jgi:hypothetical protein
MWSSWIIFPPHESELTLSLIEATGAQVLFLPAYSADLNPIEKMWSKVKAYLRGAEARTRPDLLREIASTLESVTSKDAMNWFASCDNRLESRGYCLPSPRDFCRNDRVIGIPCRCAALYS